MKYSLAEVTLSSVDRFGVRKRLGSTALGYIFQTLSLDEKLFGTSTMFSVICNLRKTGPILLDPLQTFCEL